MEWLERLKRDTDVSEWAESLKIILNEYNRQKQEIERLKKSVKEAVSCFTRMESLYKIKCKELEVAKSEAIKEFAERICNGRVSNDPVVIAVRTELECMKEMEGSE